jgi:hypothetical protein
MYVSSQKVDSYAYEFHCGFPLGFQLTAATEKPEIEFAPCSGFISIFFRFSVKLQ